MSGGLWPAGSAYLSNSAKRAFWGLCSWFASPPARKRRNAASADQIVFTPSGAREAGCAGRRADHSLGFTGREEISEAYVFAQEENFYYLTGHNEEGVRTFDSSPGKGGSPPTGPREILFLPAKNLQKEKWNGVRMFRGSRHRSAHADFLP